MVVNITIEQNSDPTPVKYREKAYRGRVAVNLNL